MTLHREETINRRKAAVLLSLILVTLALASLAALAATQPQILFTDNVASSGPSAATTQMEAELLQRLNNASSSIDAAIYELDRQSIRDALIAAALVAVYDELQATGTLRTGSAQSAVIRPKDPLDDLTF